MNAEIAGMQCMGCGCGFTVSAYESYYIVHEMHWDGKTRTLCWRCGRSRHTAYLVEIPHYQYDFGIRCETNTGKELDRYGEPRQWPSDPVRRFWINGWQKAFSKCTAGGHLRVSTKKLTKLRERLARAYQRKS